MTASETSASVVLKAIPTEQVEKNVLAYLAARLPDRSPEQLAALIRRRPVAVLQDLAPDEGRAVCRELIQMGATAALTSAADPDHPSAAADAAAPDPTPAQPTRPAAAAGRGSGFNLSVLIPAILILAAGAIYFFDPLGNRAPADPVAVSQRQAPPIPPAAARKPPPSGGTAAAAAAVLGPVRLAVCPFDLAPARQPRDAADTVADLLTAGLLAAGPIELVERADIDKALAEMTAGLASLRDKDTIVRIGRLLRADLLVTGTWLAGEPSPSAMVKVTEAGTGIVKHLALVAVENNDLEACAQRLTAAVATAADRSPGSVAEQKFVAVGGFADNSINDRQIEQGDAMRRFLQTRFGALPAVTLVARSQVNPLLEEAGLAASGTGRHPSDADPGPAGGGDRRRRLPHLPDRSHAHRP
jgi:hypothetical protein